MTRPGKMRTVGAAGLACACCLLAAPVASAAPTWLSPTDLSAPQRNANNVDVAMDDAGDVVAVWERDGFPSHPVQASVKTAGSAFSAPVDLAGAGSAPDVAITPGGEAIVVYTQLINGINMIRVRLRPPGGSFSAPIDVAALAGGGASIDPEVAVNGAGAAVVGWRDKGEPEKFVIQAATRPAGGSFSEPTTISDTSESAGGRPSVAVDSAGEATIAWTDIRPVEGPEENHGVVQVSSGSGASFSEPEDVSTVDLATEPKLALGPGGEPTVIWQGAELEVVMVEEEEELKEKVVALPSAIEGRTESGGSFGPVFELSDDPSVDSFRPRLAIGAGGQAVAAWLVENAESEFSIEVATRSGGGVFTSPVEIPGEEVSTSSLGVSVNPAGAATVVWQAGAPTVVQASSRPPGGSFGPPTDLSTPGQDSLFPEVAMGAAGDAVAVWRRFDGVNFIAQAAGFDANPPQMRALSVPAGATVGEPVTVSAEGFDVWGITATEFNFGDGSSAVGNPVSHIYASPGVYQVTATVHDPAGGTASASGSIAITASNDFRLGKLKRNKRKGLATLTVEVPGPGTLVLTGPGAKRARKVAKAAGAVALPVKPNKGSLKKLRRGRKVRVRVTVEFSPTGGSPARRRKLVVLVMKRHGKHRAHRRARAHRGR
ncbi:MAG TPA: PKD domain-containing protein [Solirubrobacterales bacterium]